MRLLCIANPDAYQGTVTDVPLSYARLAAHPDIELFHADTRDMLASGQRIRATRVAAGFMPHEFGELSRRRFEKFEPDHFDVAFCRTLKPFPDGYLERLERWSEKLAFVNDPAGIQQQLQPEFFLTAAAKFTPPTIITTDEAEASGFLQRHGTVVAKRANSCGGRGVFRISQAPKGPLLMDNIVEGSRAFDDFSPLFAYLTRNGAESLLVMRYLPRVIEGDKRIVVVDGEIFGAYLRTSPNHHWVQNVSFGGGCELVPVEPADQRIVAATCGHYREAGIHILGYDLLRADDGDRQISEINAGNIGGLFRIEYLGVAGVTDRFVDWLHEFVGREKGRAGRAAAPPATHHS